MNKNKIILLSVILVIILAVLFWLFIRMNDRAKINQPATQSFRVEYMTVEEKAAKNMDPNTKAQVLQRDSGNNVTIYKVIRKDSDVITDLSQLEAPRPPRPGSQN